MKDTEIHRADNIRVMQVSAIIIGTLLIMDCIGECYTTEGD